MLTGYGARVIGDAVADRRVLEPRPHSVRQARRIVGEALATAGRDDLVEAVELVVSELVTNALLHAGTTIALSVHAGVDGVLLEVADGSAHLPAQRDYATLAGTGRGLGLVHRLADSWGSRPTPAGKTVWAWVTDSGESEPADVPASAPARTGPDDDADRRVAPGAVAVRLLNLPLLMHLVWHQHADALLREYLLARLEADEEAALAEHAMASDAMALLYDQIPAPDLPGATTQIGDVDELLTFLVEPRPTLRSGWLEVPAESLRSFRVLDGVMERALALADADELLAAPVQPELRELRRWICAEVARQGDGGRPRPWTPPTSAPPPGAMVSTAEWDSAPVDRSTKALVAADDSDRIIAVSDPALALLGYDDAARLLGHRLLVLIPPRFHQAHLAGFTMYLTAGRRPLLDTTVTLPFVRADGVEVSMTMEVGVVQTAGGRRVFVAEITQPG